MALPVHRDRRDLRVMLVRKVPLDLQAMWDRLALRGLLAPRVLLALRVQLDRLVLLDLRGRLAPRGTRGMLAQLVRLDRRDRQGLKARKDPKALRARKAHPRRSTWARLLRQRRAVRQSSRTWVTRGMLFSTLSYPVARRARKGPRALRTL